MLRRMARMRRLDSLHRWIPAGYVTTLDEGAQRCDESVTWRAFPGTAGMLARAAPQGAAREELVMQRSRSTALGLCLVAALGAVAVARIFASRSASAQQANLVRDFFGEADEEVTAVTPVPSGMTCGGLSVGSGLTVQTTEPAGGFTGACLMNRSYGGASLPTVCFSPDNATYVGTRTDGGTGTSSASVQCSVPAANVVQPDWSIGPAQGASPTRQNTTAYQVLETCAPHVQGGGGDCAIYPNGGCPCNTTPVSQSCCTHYGTKMASSDGMTATGTAYFSVMQ
jgi:hypothetical protein